MLRRAGLMSGVVCSLDCLGIIGPLAPSVFAGAGDSRIPILRRLHVSKAIGQWRFTRGAHINKVPNMARRLCKTLVE